MAAEPSDPGEAEAGRDTPAASLLGHSAAALEAAWFAKRLQQPVQLHAVVWMPADCCTSEAASFDC